MHYNITPGLLKEIAGSHTNDKIVNELVKYLPEVIQKYQINNDLRLANFLAQIAHESDHFRTLQEYASGNAYEGRRDLGNVKKGDGHRFKGRGVIQITGRANYERYGRELGLDLVNNPDMALEPRVSLLIAAKYWEDNNLNELADKGNTKQITRKINGGYNGLKSRLELVARARQAINESKVSLLKAVEKPVVTPVPATPEPTPVPVFNEPIQPQPVVPPQVDEASEFVQDQLHDED